MHGSGGLSIVTHLDEGVVGLVVENLHSHHVSVRREEIEESSAVDLLVVKVGHQEDAVELMVVMRGRGRVHEGIGEVDVLLLSGGGCGCCGGCCCLLCVEIISSSYSCHSYLLIH